VGVLAASVVHPPLWIELPAIVAGALAGALFGQRRGLDAIGILALALVNGLGGGIIRDVLLARVPVALEEPRYLGAVVLASIVGAFFAEGMNRMRSAITAIDAIALGLFSVIGAQSALAAQLPVSSAIMLGTITGIGGGVLRDVLVGDVPPRTLRRGAPYASASLVGSGLYVGLVAGLGVARVVAQLATVGLVCVIRGVSVWRGWETPGTSDLTPGFLRRDRTTESDPSDTEDGPGET
jgi:uncharacterized membrane protein YeiH